MAMEMIVIVQYHIEMLEMKQSLSVLLAVLIFQLAAGQLPAYIIPCNKSDPDVNSCIATSANHALPVIIQDIIVLDVPTLDVSVTLALHMFLSDRQSFLPNNLLVTNATWDFHKQHVTMEFTATALSWDVAFLATGMVLDGNIHEQGRANFTLVAPKFSYEADYTLSPVDGLVYAEITNADASTLNTNFSFSPLQQESVGAQITDKQQTEFLKLAQGLMDNLIEDVTLLAIEIVNTSFNFVLESAPFQSIFLP